MPVILSSHLASCIQPRLRQTRQQQQPASSSHQPTCFNFEPPPSPPSLLTPWNWTWSTLAHRSGRHFVLHCYTGLSERCRRDCLVKLSPNSPRPRSPVRNQSPTHDRQPNAVALVEEDKGDPLQLQPTLHAGPPRYPACPLSPALCYSSLLRTTDNLGHCLWAPCCHTLGFHSSLVAPSSQQQQRNQRQAGESNIAHLV